MSASENLTQVVPFLGVTDIERSLRFYLDGLGFAIKHKWEPEGRIRWCWLTRGGASLMLQEFAKPEEKKLSDVDDRAKSS